MATIEMQVGSLKELEDVIMSHGGSDGSNFNPVPYAHLGDDAPLDCIGEQTCNDGTSIIFSASSVELANEIYEQMFDMG